jgi:hypothetical protein
VVPAEDLGLPGPDGAGESSELGHVTVAAVGVEVGQPAPGGLGTPRGVDLAEQFLLQVGGAHLAGRVSTAEPLFDTLPAALA